MLPHQNVDPDGLLEYSVVYTDRSLNHMSARFQSVIRGLSQNLKEVYGATAVAIVPGGGTFAMEAVARQFATGVKCLVVRNGFFSFRWTQIFEAGDIPEECRVLMAQQQGDDEDAPFTPVPADEVAAAIRSYRPQVVFAPHVETASGILLPDNYLQEVAAAVHEVGGLFVLDCIASGALWVDMRQIGVDVLISAPQKGWSSTPCAGLVMLGDRALEVLDQTQSTSFACDLKSWLNIMRAYESGGHAYHATMPTDGLFQLGEAIEAAKDIGFENLRAAQWQLGSEVRQCLTAKGFKSVAAPGFEAPCVVVSYTRDLDIQSGLKFREQGLQIAAGVPLKCDEPDGFRTFRIGLFGLDKLEDPETCVARLEEALSQIVSQPPK